VLLRFQQLSYHGFLVVIMKKILLKTARKYLINAPAGRRVSVKDSDIFITSYPKSGNTWVRFLIANMLYSDGSTNFFNINQRVPDIYTLTDHKLLGVASPRCLKSHEYFDPRYPRVIYVVRDVRSVVVSLYHHLQMLKQLPEDQNIDEFVLKFLSGTTNNYGSWRENVLSWTSVRAESADRFLLVKYENLKDDCESELARISDYLQLGKSAAEIEQIVQLSSFERMKKLESEGIDSKMLGKKHRSVKTGFVRAGKTTDWKQLLSEESLHTIDVECGDLLENLGYERK